MNEEETYNMYGQKLVDLIEEMEQASVTPQLAACLLLDKTVDLTFFLHTNTDGTFDESEGRLLIQKMVDEKAETYRQRPTNN